MMSYIVWLLVKEKSLCSEEEPKVTPTFLLFSFLTMGKKTFEKKREEMKEREREEVYCGRLCIFISIRNLTMGSKPAHIAVEKFRATFWRLESCVETTKKLLLMDFFCRLWPVLFGRISRRAAI